MTEWAEVPRRLRLLKPLLIPLGTAIVVAVVGVWTLAVLERSVKARVTAILTSAVRGNVTAIDVWVEAKEAVVEVVAADPRVVALAQAIVQASQGRNLSADALRRLPEAARLRDLIASLPASHDFGGYGILDQNGRLLAARAEELVGLHASLDVQDALSEISSGETVTAGALLLPARGDGEVPGLGRPMMLVAAPIRGPTGAVPGVLAFAIDLAGDFTRILSVGRFGESGESYAFNDDGLLLSESRFDAQLRQIGLLPPDTSVGSALRIWVRDPGRDLLRQGGTGTGATGNEPLTRMALSAIAGQDSLDVDGYRDYRGVRSVGAWQWLPQYGFGVATELDFNEAYHPLRVLRRAFGALLALLVLTAIGMLVYSVVVERLRRRVRQATRLGRYTLIDKIGEGGMGQVYRARHAMLRRPTAVKLIREGEVTPEALARFEREVQHTSQLTHPNTVAIYDYGRTPEGVFYYAMEYLDGMTLDRVVGRDGPQPEARVVGILRQACGSLAEAHAADLIHRDIKPSNIMICARSGSYDVVKVLDFGLVKELRPQTDQEVTAIDAVTGTPNYMAPEQINAPETVNARTDLYGLGAVAYYLLTGHPVFEGRSLIEIMGHHLYKAPATPSERLGRKVDSRLEGIVMQCLSKDPNGRPADAGALNELLADGLNRDTPPWTSEMAAAWWERQEAHREAAPVPGSGEGQEIEIDLSERLGSGK